MRSKFKWIFTLLVALTMQFSFAQEKTVTGVVSDSSGPLPGANVVVQGTTRGVQTDLDGKYSIKANVGETLVFSFIGLEDQSRKVGAANTISLTLSDSKTVLTEVVIDGYRSVSKTKSTVAQTTITSKTIENRPNVNFLQSLQAQVPGLYIATSSGSPGTAKTNSLIRGVSSLSASNEPLIVIDGVPSPQSVLRGLNPNDIESATVLKDAAATAIYGNRASAGVIVVKTRNGKPDSKLTFRYSGTTGTTVLQDHDYGLPNTREILTLERAKNAGLGATGGVGGGPMTDAEIAAFPIDTNWKDYFFRTGRTMSHDLSISGGSSRLTNFTSLGYFDQEGIVPTTNFKRFSIRSNFTGKSENEKFNYSTNIYAGYSKRNQLDQETRTDINANILQNPLQGYLSSLPYLDPNVYVSGQQLFNDFGAPSFQITPYMLMDYLVPGNIPSLWEETKILLNSSASLKLTKTLTFTQSAGIDYTQSNRDFARAPWSYLAIAATPAGAQYGGIEVFQDQRDLVFNAVSKLNFNKPIGKHTIDANLFWEYVKGHRKANNFQQNGLDPRTWAFGAGTGYVPFNTATPTLYRPTVSASKADWGLLSYFASFDYDYDTRFGVGATLRRDASSKFSEINRWGTFFSASARWNIDNEKFFENNKIFNELKLRVSYGQTGNAGLGGQFGGLNLIRDIYASTTGYANAPSLTANLSNPEIQWEVTTQTNIGLDFGVMNRVSGAVDFYRKQTDDLFDNRDISYVNGQTTLQSNVGSIRNQGVELNLRYDMFKNTEFKLELFGNGAYNKATYLTTVLPGDADQPNGNLIRYVDGLINEYYVAPVHGINPANGNILFLDINGNVTETIGEADRRKTGKSNFPKYQGGFGFNSSYKGFFLNTQFSYAAEVWRFDFDLTNLSDPNLIGTFPVTTDLLDAWSPTNPSDSVPSLNADPNNLTMADTFSDRWLKDASYVRLKVLTFGYNVPSKYLDNTLLKSVRIYSLLENYFTWTKWRGFDAESFGVSNQGGYPAPKSLSFGLDVQF